MDISNIQNQLRKFSLDREWDQSHSPKNLAMALGAEAGSLLQVFQWSTDEQSCNPTPQVRAKATEELSDVLIYALRLADKLNIDINSAVKEKMAINEKKFPIEKT